MMEFLLIILLLTTFVRAQENTFLVPPPPGANGYYAKDLVWPVNSFQTISWICNFSQWTVYLYHNNGVGDGSPVRITSGFNTVSGQQETNYVWNVTTDTDFVDFPTYWIGLDGGSDGGAQTHYVNISAPLSSTTTSSSFTSTSPPSSSSTSSTTSPTKTLPPTPNSKGNQGTKIGVGVGVPVAFLAIATVVFFFWRKERLSKKGGTGNGEHTAYLDAKQEMLLNEKMRFEMQGTRLAHELPTIRNEGNGPEHIPTQISELHAEERITGG